MDKDAKTIRAMYARISHRYDLANKLLSMGMDAGWRRETTRLISPESGGKVLDVAAGTLDLAIEIKKHYRKSTNVYALDYSIDMLLEGRGKPMSQGLGIIQSDALNLPFESSTFDAATIAFGIRNLESNEKGLTEMARVLKPGGKCLILEFSMPESSQIMRFLYTAYLRWVIPIVGFLLTCEKAYFYLRDSITEFPRPDEFKKLMMDAGFVEITHKPLTMGIVTLYSGMKP